MKSSLLKKSLIIDQAAADISLYDSYFQHRTKNNLPFLVTAETLHLEKSDKIKLLALGPALKELLTNASELYQKPFNTYFIRPDVLVTREGIKVCEIETQPFGLALTIFLQTSQREWNKVLGQDIRYIFTGFIDWWKQNTGGNKGIFVYSDHTDRFKGQLTYLANSLNSYGGDFSIRFVEDLTNEDIKNNFFYRAFYTYEAGLDKSVGHFLASKPKLFPQIDPYFEGKYLLADYFADNNLRKTLSTETIKILDQLFLPTWFVKDSVPANFPLAIKSWDEIVSHSRDKLKFVIKMAGNHPDASWAKSVNFLHKKSKVQLTQLFKSIKNSNQDWLIQPFIGNEKVSITYATEDFADLLVMRGRIRLTPYFEYKSGALLNVKATIRRNTLLVHASSDSVNTVVSDD
ncbi:MAG: hypothetical protein IT416_01120 [Candidatus Pacebacteria bacterium]|nr:hypothetical protein [Candidatus Paceibacterota bacterium]